MIGLSARNRLVRGKIVCPAERGRSANMVFVSHSEKDSGVPEIRECLTNFRIPTGSRQFNAGALRQRPSFISSGPPEHHRLARNIQNPWAERGSESIKSGKCVRVNIQGFVGLQWRPCQLLSKLTFIK